MDIRDQNWQFRQKIVGMFGKTTIYVLKRGNWGEICYWKKIKFARLWALSIWTWTNTFRTVGKKLSSVFSKVQYSKTEEQHAGKKFWKKTICLLFFFRTPGKSFELTEKTLFCRSKKLDSTSPDEHFDVRNNIGNFFFDF